MLEREYKINIGMPKKDSGVFRIFKTTPKTQESFKRYRFSYYFIFL